MPGKNSKMRLIHANTAAYISALQSFVVWCTLKDVLTNSCTLFT